MGMSFSTLEWKNPIQPQEGVVFLLKAKSPLGALPAGSLLISKGTKQGFTYQDTSHSKQSLPCYMAVNYQP